LARSTSLTRLSLSALAAGFVVTCPECGNVQTIGGHSHPEGDVADLSVLSEKEFPFSTRLLGELVLALMRAPPAAAASAKEVALTVPEKTTTAVKAKRRNCAVHRGRKVDYPCLTCDEDIYHKYLLAKSSGHCRHEYRELKGFEGSVDQTDEYTESDRLTDESRCSTAATSRLRRRQAARDLRACLDAVKRAENAVEREVLGVFRGLESNKSLLCNKIQLMAEAAKREAEAVAEVERQRLREYGDKVMKEMRDCEEGKNHLDCVYSMAPELSQVLFKALPVLTDVVAVEAVSCAFVVEKEPAHQPLQLIATKVNVGGLASIEEDVMGESAAEASEDFVVFGQHDAVAQREEDEVKWTHAMLNRFIEKPVISYIESPSLFYVMLSDHRVMAHQLKNRLLELAEVPHPLPDEKLVNGSACLLDEGGSALTRATILGVDCSSEDDVVAKVRLVDKGEEKEVSATFVKIVDKGIANCAPVLAARCCLVDAEPFGGKQWTNEAVECFRDLAFSSSHRLVMKVERYEPDDEHGGWTHHVAVGIRAPFDILGEDPCPLSAYMAFRGHVDPATIGEVALKQVMKATERVQYVEALDRELKAGNELHVEVAPSGYDHGHIRVFLTEKGVVSNVGNLAAVRRQLDELHERANGNYDILYPRPGQPCAVRDNSAHLVRGRITEIRPAKPDPITGCRLDERIHVLCMDTGETLERGLQDVWLIPSRLVDIPVQTAVLALHGLGPPPDGQGVVTTRKTWTDTIVDFLRKVDNLLAFVEPSGGASLYRRGRYKVTAISRELERHGMAVMEGESYGCVEYFSEDPLLLLHRGDEESLVLAELRPPDMSRLILCHIINVSAWGKVFVQLLAEDALSEEEFKEVERRMAACYRRSDDDQVVDSDAIEDGAAVSQPARVKS